VCRSTGDFLPPIFHGRVGLLEFVFLFVPGDLSALRFLFPLQFFAHHRVKLVFFVAS
jgi:hypothetical protein